MSDRMVLQNASRTCMGLREVEGNNHTVQCSNRVSAPNCFCERHSTQSAMLTATSIAAFNAIVRDIKQLPLSTTDHHNKIDAAVEALQEDIKDHLRAALCSIEDRIQSLKKRKSPSPVTQAEAYRALEQLAEFRRLVTCVERGHPGEALHSLGVVPDEAKDATASRCPVCIERRATRIILGTCGHTVCAKCVSSNPAANCPVCRGTISFLMHVY